MDFLYTRHQVMRVSRPDADVNGTVYLIKNVTLMRLTYQVRWLTHAAQTRGRKVVIRLPEDSRVHETLKAFMQDHPTLIKTERT